MVRSLIAISDLSDDDISKVIELSSIFHEVNSREIPKVPVLRGKTVATLFFENSTRTRLSFEIAASRLSADVLTFTLATSSVSKGESLRDTVETIESLGADLVVMRHHSSGAVGLVASWLDIPVVNAGDGAHQHPTQALLDTVTISNHFQIGKRFDGLRIAIVGDVIHSRVARSNIELFTRLGAEVVLVGPASFIPNDLSPWNVTTCYSLDELLPEIDVLYLLRIQEERFSEAMIPSLGDFAKLYSLTRERFARFNPDGVVMHPGPVIRGVEAASDVIDSARSLIRTQVRNGVAVRMAILHWLLGSPEGRMDTKW